MLFCVIIFTTILKNYQDQRIISFYKYLSTILIEFNEN